MPESVTMPEWVGTTFSPEIQKDPAIAGLFNPDDKGNPPDLAKYKSADDFLKGYRGLQEVAGKKGILVPTEKSTPEEISKFYQSVMPTDKSRPEEVAAFRRALGHPEKADGYKFSDVKDLHPGLQVTPESQRAFAEAMHKAGVPQQYADIFNQFGSQYLSQILAQGEKANKERIEKQLGDLKAEWGDKFEENFKGAETLVKKVLGEKEAVELGSLTDNPAGLKFLQKLSTVISPDAISKIVTGGGQQLPDQESAKKELEDIMQDAKGARQHPMNDPKHAEHNKWQGAEGLWTKLNQRAYKPAGS